MEGASGVGARGEVLEDDSGFGVGDTGFVDNFEGVVGGFEEIGSEVGGVIEEDVVGLRVEGFFCVNAGSDEDGNARSHGAFFAEGIGGAESVGGDRFLECFDFVNGLGETSGGEDAFTGFDGFIEFEKRFAFEFLDEAEAEDC